MDIPLPLPRPPILADSLRHINLKPVAAAPERNIAIQQQLLADGTDDDSTRTYFFQSGIDLWYDNLKEFTFPSASVPISRLDAQLIAEYFSSSSSTNDTTPLPPQFDDLIQRIQECMDTTFRGCDRFFVKLSTRSPKDSKTAFRRAVATYKDQIRAQLDLDENARWTIFTEAMGNATSVSDGRDAVGLLLDSERVAEDLSFGLEDSSWSGTQVIVRPWDSRVKLWSEFRGFVWNEQLNCLGQYYHPLFFSCLQSAEINDIIKSDCLDLFNAMKAKGTLPVANALIDFAWFGPGQVMLIEINPLSETLGCFPASTGLFDWEKDRSLIQRPKAEEFCARDITLRIRTEPETSYNLKLKSRPEWREIIYDSHHRGKSDESGTKTEDISA